jgi:Mn2+/Fe2+ NRAMP family transporter
VIVLMLLLINRKDLMGKHTNSHWFNAIAWATAIIVSILSVMLMVQQFRGHG